MLHAEPKDLTPLEVQNFLLGGVGPRPIALVSTLSKKGIANLSPFSFFNAYGCNPPMVAFCPSRRLRDATLKHTYLNLVATKECVIQCVTHAMVEQVNLASTEYGESVDEFVKSGLTPVASDLVKPPRVAESPFQMECRLHQMIELGEGKGAGNLALCKVVKFHIAEELFRDGLIQPDLIDLVARMSGNFYARASGKAVFEVEKPVAKTGIGFDQLPAFLLSSPVFTKNDLGRLANVELLPSAEEVRKFMAGIKPLAGATPAALERLISDGDAEQALAAALGLVQQNHSETRLFFERVAQVKLRKRGGAEVAWKIILFSQGI